jgi:tetratricopeptide (TPR) repeat protein
MKKKKIRADSKATVTPPGQWTCILLLLLTALVAYWNSFDVPFVFDDLSTIEKNAAVRFGEFNWSLLSGRAVLYLLFTLNYAWTSQDVWSYHVVNLALHFVNGTLIFLIAERLFDRGGVNFQSRIGAALAAGLFLVHPVQTESVTYISSRSELLSTCFYLIGLMLFILWPDRRAGFLLSLIIVVPFVLGIGSKETVITLPAALVLYDFLFLSNGSFRPLLSRWRFYATFLIGGAAIIYYFLTGPLSQSIGGAVPGNLPGYQYFLTELRVLILYIRILFLPVGLNLDYDFRPSTGFEPAVIVSLVILVSILMLAWFLRRKAPVLAFSIFWFFVTLSPTSSVVSILDVIFEHRLYLPLAGVCLSFPVLLVAAREHLRARIRLPGSAVAWGVLILSALTVATLLRNQVWRDEVRLFTDVVDKSPHKDRAYNSLAYAHFKRGDNAAAIDVLKKALVMVPGKEMDFTETLANVYLKAGNLDEAIRLFEQTTRELDGRRVAIAYNNLGGAWLYKWNALQAQSNQMAPQAFSAANEAVLAPAAGAFARALEIAPDMASALDSWITAMYGRGKGSEIVLKAAEDLKVKEDFTSLYILGKGAFLNADWAGADQYFDRAARFRPDVKILHFNHGYALAAMGKDDQAIEQYLQAIRLDPIFFEAHNNVALSYMRQNEFASALEHFKEVLRFEPRHFSANLGLAKIYRQQGNMEAARRHLQTALEVSPGNLEVAALMKEIR